MTVRTDLPPLSFGQHYARVTFPMSWCRHDYDSLTRVARGYARDAGLEVVASTIERGTVAVYVIEPPAGNARLWQRYRDMPCSSAQRV